MPDALARLQMANSIDPYSPPEIAARIEASGVAKAEAPLLTTLVLGVLAGVFISFGAMLYTVVMTGVDAGFGPARLLGGTAFSLGLVHATAPTSGSTRKGAAGEREPGTVGPGARLRLCDRL